MLQNQNYGGEFFSPGADKIRMQALWQVDERNFKNNCTESRFKYGPRELGLLEINANDGCGPFSSCRMPKGLIRFVNHFNSLLNVEPTDFSPVEDVIYRVFYDLDFGDPYCIFTDSPIQLCEDQYKFTFRLNDSNVVLDPEKIELFRVVPGWKFDPFHAVMSVVNHEMTQKVMRGHAVENPRRPGTYLTRDDVLERLVHAITHRYYKDFVADIVDIVNNHYWDMTEDAKSAYQADDAKVFREHDKLFWMTTTIAVHTWLKSPHALKFLIESHPIYGDCLEWDDEQQIPLVDRYTKGEVLVHGWDVYHPRSYTKIPIPPGSCIGCGELLYCTKRVNSTALFRPNECDCTVGSLDPLDTELENHGHKCISRKNICVGFVCQKCMHSAVTRTSFQKCQRTSCPNLDCKWHMGFDYRRAEMNKNRRLLLSQQVTQ